VSTLKVTDIQHPSAVDPAIELDAAGKLWLAGGKILQIVRATDSTQRSTTSTSYVDVTGMSVTITPQKDDSAILVIATFYAAINTDTQSTSTGEYRLTDASNNTISGAEFFEFGDVRSVTLQPRSPLVMIGRSTPAITSAVTYKMQFRSPGAGTSVFAGNANTTSQMYAIEVSA
jgi:hypothetical protein